MSQASKSPLLIEWSPLWVRVFDPVAHETVTGESLRSCITSDDRGRDAVVAISQRSVFIRTLEVPSARPDDLHKLILLNVSPLLPIKMGEAVIGYRAPQGLTGRAKIAIVGAAKAEAIETIYRECKDLGLKVQAVLPLAFASWRAAQELDLFDCAVVTRSQNVLNIDLISGGELVYSRSVAASESADEHSEQVLGSFRMAELPSAPILTGPGVHLSEGQPIEREPLEFLANAALVKKQIFSFQLPGRGEAKQADSQLPAVRALATLTGAVLLAGYIFLLRPPQSGLNPHYKSALALKAAERQEASAKARSDRAIEAANVLDAAFKPAQSFTDVVTTIANRTAPTSWLTGATIERGKPLLIRGHALSGKEVAKYVQDLAKQDRFNSVKLVSAGNTLVGKEPYVQFVVSGYALGLKPVPKTKKAGAKA